MCVNKQIYSHANWYTIYNIFIIQGGLGKTVTFTWNKKRDGGYILGILCYS